VSIKILIGDMRLRLAELPDNSVDSAVCDPPYHLTSIVKRFGKEKSHLEVAAHKDHEKIKAPQYKRLSKGFMGQTWDGGDVAFQPETWAEVLRVLKPGGHCVAFSGCRTYHRMACAIEDAGFDIREMCAWVFGSGFPKSHNLSGEWEGWGSALKPALEPICLARKPLSEKSIAANVLKWGTGALNIDATRIGTTREVPASHSKSVSAVGATGISGKRLESELDPNIGRWPANLIHDGSDEVVAGFPNVASGYTDGRKAGVGSVALGDYGAGKFAESYGDSGSAARFFYCAKASGDERGEGNNHPTVKPVDLMRWLVRLVTPKGGTVLDPFMGSGSTLIAADAEQFHAIGCELSPEYAAIAERRIRDAAGMFADVRIAA
jgi:site-specific DNA-methyltransferase (adenine-specific)